MGEYIYKATSLITEVFDERSIKYQVEQDADYEQIIACFSVESGPVVAVRFISRDNDNDVAVRIFGLVSKIPEGKRSRVIEACNIINRDKRYFKFYVGKNGNLNAEYDFLRECPDESVGVMAYEVLAVTMHLLNMEYPLIMKALFTEEDLEDQPAREREIMRKIQAFRSMLEKHMLETENSRQQDDDGEMPDDEYVPQGEEDVPF